VDQRTRLDDGDVEALAGIPVAKPEMGHQSSACGVAIVVVPHDNATQPTDAEVRSFPLHYFSRIKSAKAAFWAPDRHGAAGGLAGWPEAGLGRPWARFRRRWLCRAAGARPRARQGDSGPREGPNDRYRGARQLNSCAR
jgi:hypothetical protein